MSKNNKVPCLKDIGNIKLTGERKQTIVEAV